MEKYESKISTALGAHLSRSFFLLLILYFLLHFSFNVDFTSISITYYILFVLAYILYSYIYLGSTNNDFIIFNNRVEIINKLPFFKRKTIFYFEDIKQVLFRHEWTESVQEKIKPRILSFILTDFFLSMFFPYDYKWIRFTTQKSYTFYCFGLEFDYYDNEGPLIEDLFHRLGDYGVNVCWTNNELNYYKGMMKNMQSRQNPNNT